MSGERTTLRRLEALESQAAFQEELLTRLDAVVARQDREMTEFRRQLKEIAARLREIGEVVRYAASGAGPAEETPPHY